MTSKFDSIDALKQKIDSAILIEDSLLQKLETRFRMEFNYNSNHLEGNTLSYTETKLLLIFDRTTGDHFLREYEEVKGHDVCWSLIRTWSRELDFELTEKHIKELNELLLVRPFWKEAITLTGQSTKRQIQVGEYKTFPNSVVLQNGTIFQYASPADTPILMGELVQWLRKEVARPTMHPLEIAALLHYKFVRIHPFDDGNGRLSRLLMNYVLLRFGFPPVVVKSSDKKSYLLALNEADAGNLDAFVEYVSNLLLSSLTLIYEAISTNQLEEDAEEYLSPTNQKYKQYLQRGI